TSSTPANSTSLKPCLPPNSTANAPSTLTSSPSTLSSSANSPPLNLTPPASPTSALPSKRPALITKSFKPASMPLTRNSNLIAAKLLSSPFRMLPLFSLTHPPLSSNSSSLTIRLISSSSPNPVPLHHPLPTFRSIPSTSLSTFSPTASTSSA